MYVIVWLFQLTEMVGPHNYTKLIVVRLNCLLFFFIHSKLELLTQFQASNDERYITITNYYDNFSGILFGLKLASTRVYTVTAGEGLTLL